MTSQPPLFHEAYDQPPDLTTCVDRLPGTVDAACLCGRDECLWPFCPWKKENDE